MNLDVSPLEKAIGQLEKSLSFYNSEMAEENFDLKLQFRTAVIKGFEFTYELAVKMIKRQLGLIVANPTELNEMTFMDLMRTAQEAGLIREAPTYKLYRDKRNMTSHTYEEDKALEVLSIVDPFLQDMRFVLNELKRRNRGSNEAN
jgi:nucleotidyltransferase substrate binding protein (TIGR01987 family)